MKFLRNFRATLPVMAFVFSAPGLLGQGSLTPPPGPPGPTMKTLAQIEPRTAIATLPLTISSAGAYYLTTNLTGVAGSNGITINANDVTLDLNGFTVSGVAGSLNGLQFGNGLQNISVVNGTVNGWAIGIDARTGANSRFEALRMSGNRAQGLAAGESSIIVKCNASANQGVGISADTSSSVLQCTARANVLHGIAVEDGSRVAESIASHNTGNGIVLGDNCTIVDSVASNNTGSGVFGALDAQISGTKAANNGAHGFALDSQSTLHRCSATGNLGNGINAAGGAQVLECKAIANTKGIVVQSQSTVRGCTTLQNSGAGISVTAECMVAGNHAAGNFLARDAAGIHATGTDNSIQENTLVSNDWGLRVEVPGNLIIKNSAANNSLNYFVTGTPQAMGPVVSGIPPEFNNPAANIEF